ncbi:MAG: hypothetical protein J6U00_04500 [Ruminococcus sp.]|uniref:hypothetical protein n=1 Tax=Ruminococcus sp. TaxID=41978 RepID=UPI001B2F10A1|nr:hypothetical protein [Ruminococcus sp.]MBO7473253.1 hypothetical protein [Ruminococcus sp.]
MKKRLLGLTASSFIFAAALTGCTVSSGTSSFSFSVSKGDDERVTTKSTDTAKKKNSRNNASNDELPDIKYYTGSYTCNGYVSWGGSKYPDCKTIQNDLENDPMTISADGTMHFHGTDYKLIPEGTKNEAVIFSIDGSGFDFGSFSKNGSVNKDYDGAAYFTKETQHFTINDEDSSYETYKVCLTAAGDESSSAYILFSKD